MPPKSPLSTTTNNSIAVHNLPPNARQVDINILVAKTHVAPFLSDSWLDTETNIGHLLLKKEKFMGFVLFVLNRHFSQEDELKCFFEQELVTRSQRNRLHTPHQRHTFNDAFNDDPYFDLMSRDHGQNGRNLAIIIIFS
uniref:Uncharacterized protein n=1 Tax=Vannella robusta TaxID=1487602 RepID=A0A7S4M3W5_9EUKA|mmetsp:Transcript_10015/g.12327  ORF Transcript_10015/g.12327 Transcript_10015/m.12327 type:complete len:139 (+) Transcript_10015:26-442(+)